MRQGNRILIRGTNWIGDSVMSLAALREVRRLFPEHHLTLLVRDWVSGVFENQGLVDEILPMESNSSRLRPWVRLVSKIRHFDSALLFQNAFRAALVTRLAGIPKRIGYKTDGRALLLTHRARPRIKELNRHQIYYYLDLLYQTGLSSQDYLNDPHFRPDIHLTASDDGMQRAKQLLRSVGVSEGQPTVLINPGAFYGSAKRWFTNRYAALAERLIEKDQAQVILIGSEGEKLIAEEIQSFTRHPLKTLTGQTDLPALMGLLSQCDLLLTNDSGPMHLAAALDTPQIAILGSTDEIATGPFSPRAQVIHKHVECSPCLLRECPIDLRCFSRIEVDEVYESARALLHNGHLSGS
jgi:heptosyltransferase-2